MLPINNSLSFQVPSRCATDRKDVNDLKIKMQIIKQCNQYLQPLNRNSEHVSTVICKNIKWNIAAILTYRRLCLDLIVFP